MRSKLLYFYIVSALLAFNISCTDMDSLDNKGFQLYYSGVTDIGPSMSFNLNGPTYHGGKPSDFSITNIKLDGNAVETNSFTIDPTTGAIAIANTNNLGIGLYTLTISCISNGKHYTFEDIVAINMMRPIPKGISVEPDMIEVSLEDLLDPDNTNEITTAQVTTDGDHITIRKYIISSVRKNDVVVKNEGLFNISSSGVISLDKGAENIQPGKYIIDLRLTTSAVDEESQEGIFPDALVVNITSKPLALTYTPNNARVEFGSGATSLAPVLIGSDEMLRYSIKSVTPASAPVTMNETTGEISLSENNDLPIGTQCEISVTVMNQFGSADFDNAYTIDIVAFINPIENFSYTTPNEFSQALGFEITPSEIDGDEVTFEFVDLPSGLADLQIDRFTGKITAEKGNKIAIGDYNMTVSATNIKSEKRATINLRIKKNPYYFTYFRWGNNLNLSPAENYASQFRVQSSGNLLNLAIPVVDSDIPEGVEVDWRIVSTNFSGGSVAIDGEGAITFNQGWITSKTFVIVVEATTGKGLPEETVVRVPLFIHCSGAAAGVTIEYTPFVLQVNPRTGGHSARPVVTGTNMDQFLMDYRRNFQYYNVNGPASHLNGQPSNTRSFMYSIWKAYYDAVGSPSVNTGARSPMSYLDNKTRTSVPAAYVNPDLSVIVNPDKWKDDNGYANGVIIGQMTFATNGNEGSVGSGTQVFPLAIWFDTNF
ncbi:surface glycan-binding family protein [Proteiniphilum sp. X52]|uniref:surface glycan-binding family protein n=1 Tax=Proteiniphilum sp. X52 TaxID=2382159 RepID=UPI001314A2F4|nr:surface glycan-binding family protein [Proteiniphilum sp. X52]